MKLTNTDILSFYLTLQELVNNQGTTIFPGELGYKIVKNYVTLNNLAQDIEKRRLDIVTKFDGTQDETNGSYTIPENKREDANKELNALGQETQEVNLVLASTALLSTVSLPLNAVFNLYFMLTDSEKA